MLKNKQFARYAIIFCVLGVVMMFFYSGLQNDHLNVLYNFLPADLGWTEDMKALPVTWGGLACVIFYLVCGIGFIKVGVRKILVPSTVILGIATIALAFTAVSGNYPGYCVSLFLVRLLVVPLQMGGFMLCANWFIKYRGRVMGIITAGSPLFSVLGQQFMNRAAAASGIQGCYIILGIVCIVLAVLCALLLKDSPEDAGLYPDGSDHAPAKVAHEEEDITLGEIITSKVAWQLIVSYGILQFVINGMMAFMATRFISLGGPELWINEALIYLSIGALLGIPMSYVLGWIDDKMGSVKASLILNILYFVAVIPLTIMPQGGSKPLMLVWAFGVACMTGGMPTMHPCITSYVYGRKKYQAANKWIMTIQAIIMAFAVQYMAFFFQKGMADLAYYGMLIMLVVSLVVILTMWKIPDANLADRDYGQKAAAGK